MVNVFSEYGDISKTRELADLEAARAQSIAAVADPAYHLGLRLEAVRLEIRAAAQTISSAIGAAVEELRGEMRGER